MDIKTKEILIKMIAELRTAEYLSGFASGIQHHEMNFKQTEKANEIAYNICKLVSYSK